MYKTLLLLIITLLATTVLAQTKEEAFKGLEALCNETKGMVFYKDKTLGDQKITENEVMVSMSNDQTFQKDTYTNVNWQDISKYSFYPLKANTEVTVVTIIFNTELEQILSQTKGGFADQSIGKSHQMQLYIPASKEEEAKKYLDILKTK